MFGPVLSIALLAGAMYAVFVAIGYAAGADPLYGSGQYVGGGRHLRFSCESGFKPIDHADRALGLLPPIAFPALDGVRPDVVPAPRNPPRPVDGKRCRLAGCPRLEKATLAPCGRMAGNRRP